MIQELLAGLLLVLAILYLTARFRGSFSGRKKGGCATSCGCSGKSKNEGVIRPQQ
jgi:hypothetical protein